MVDYFEYFIDALIYNIIDAFVAVVAIAIVLRGVALIIPRFNWNTVKNDRIAIAIILSVALLVFAILVASSNLAPFPPEIANTGLME